MSTPLHDAILPVAAAHGLDPALLEAVALVESGGRADALKYEPGYYLKYLQGKQTAGTRYGPLAACSFGPLQIMLETACEQGFLGDPWELFSLTIGLAWGAKRLKYLLDWAGNDVPRALSAYNGGTGTADKGAPYPNQRYVDRVLYAMKGL
jgi:soluble lytic murein transglycosylase-like protein